MKKDRIELLAPAKNLEQGKLAITCGADAVYIGADKFGARAKVGNSPEDIGELVQFASQYYAKVYVTINTLLFDNELEPAVNLIQKFHDLGVDGIIIQDMGLLEFDLPPVPIIASTQCFINSPEKAKFFQDLGFKRIILPRELNLSQIKKIHKVSPDIELEYFVHGALCVSYSGQCYMSHALGGRSGNRGTCAQPCRKLYSISDSSGNIIIQNKHMLSLKDLNMSAHLEELINAGISSFKIEGRLKDESYIKNIVTYYRQKIDKILKTKNLKKSSSGIVITDFLPNPKKTFNRQYSDYFINGNQGKIASIDTPKMKGEFIGKVKAIKQNFIILDQSHDLANGDGISFFVKGNLHGTQINNVVNEKVYPDTVHEIFLGMEIFRNYHRQYIKNLKSLQIKRNVFVEIQFAQQDNGFRVTAIDEDGNKAEINLKSIKEFAENQELAKENLINNLMKTGNTIFHCEKVDIATSITPFLKKSEINQIRRDLLEKLLEIRIANKPLAQGKIEKSEIKYVTDKLDFRGNVINKKARQFYERHGVMEIDEGAEVGIDLINQVVMTTKYCIREELGQCLKKIKSEENPDWIMSDENGNNFRLKFRCNLCEMDVINLNNS